MKSKPWLSARLHGFVIWLFGREYTFQHEVGAKHTVRARSENAAWKKMRSFIQFKMYGGWALTYDPSKVIAELRKCRIIDPPQYGVDIRDVESF